MLSRKDIEWQVIFHALALSKTVDQLISFLLKSLKEIDIKVIEIAFHGGEPLLLPLNKFESLCQKLTSELSSHTQLKFSVQTNVTLITGEWINLFQKFNIFPGLSIDGPKHYNDKFRIDHKGQGSYDKVKHGVGLVNQAAEQGKIQSPGVISVLNGAFDYKLVTTHLTNELDIKSLSFLFPDINHDDPFPNGTNINDYNKVTHDIFNAWRQGNNFSVRQIEDVLHFFQKKGEGINDHSSYHKREKIRNQIIVVQSDGSITLDDSFIPTKEWRKKAPVSHVSATTINKFLHHDIFKEIFESYENLPDKCKNCAWQNLCRGGDLENRYSKKNGFNNPSVFCESLSILFLEVTNHLIANGYPRSEIIEKLNS